MVGLDSGLSMCGLGLHGLIELVGLCGRCVCVYGLRVGVVWVLFGGFCWWWVVSVGLVDFLGISLLCGVGII